MAPDRVALGTHVSLACAHTEFTVDVSPTAGRVDKVLCALRHAQAADYLSPADASSVRGKLGFIFSSSSYRFGRAALQPLVQREHVDTVLTFDRPLAEMLDFLEFVMPRLPPLGMRLIRDDVPPLIVYTDAMFERDAAGSPVLRVGFVVRCLVRRVTVHSHLQLPL